MFPVTVKILVHVSRDMWHVLAGVIAVVFQEHYELNWPRSENHDYFLVGEVRLPM